MTGPTVRVRVQRRGGFAGIPLTVEVSTPALDADQAKQLDELATAVERAAPEPERPPVPDGFVYEIDIWRGDRHRHLSANDPSVPAPVRELIKAVQRLSAH